MRIFSKSPKDSAPLISPYRCHRKNPVKSIGTETSSVRILFITLCVLVNSLTCSTAIQTSEKKGTVGESDVVVLTSGIWAMQPVPENDGLPLRFEERVRENPYLSGVFLHTRWDGVEKEPGKYRFDGFDSAISFLRKVGMKYKLSVIPGISTPEFVYQQGVHRFHTVVTNPHRANYGTTVTVPLPWDPIYQNHFSRLLRTLGERYSSDPLCVSVVLTCANFLSDEMHLPKRPEDMEQWKSFGDYKGKLLDVYKKYMDEWARAFPRQEICLHVSPVLHLLSSEFTEKIIEYGISNYPHRFAIQNCALSGHREDEGKEQYDIIMKYRDSVHHGFQSLASFLTQPDRMGTPEMAALNVVHADGSYWELWHGDGMSVEISQKVAEKWNEAKKMGYDAYKAKLVAEGLYRNVGDDTHLQKAKKIRPRK